MLRSDKASGSLALLAVDVFMCFTIACNRITPFRWEDADEEDMHSLQRSWVASMRTVQKVTDLAISLSAVSSEGFLVRGSRSVCLSWCIVACMTAWSVNIGIYIDMSSTMADVATQQQRLCMCPQGEKWDKVPSMLQSTAKLIA